MPRDFCSCNPLKVGAHHICDATNFGEVPEVISAGLLLRSCILECLQRHVEPDLVAVLEAVGDGLGYTVDPQFDLITLKNLNAFGIRFAGELDHLDRRIVD